MFLNLSKKDVFTKLNSCILRLVCDFLLRIFKGTFIALDVNVETIDAVAALLLVRNFSYVWKNIHVLKGVHTKSIFNPE